jgi:flavin reductase (DIM6/NTAB) family NADH-FMN oxidoreductase RutF
VVDLTDSRLYKCKKQGHGVLKKFAHFTAMIFNMAALKPAEKQYYLQHVVAPRPICFASTIDAAGNVNLSPFSFFNLFSSQPPVVVFSPARRLRDNTTKHTLQNVLEVPEVVINIVTYDMVQQTSLASCEYPKGTDEFVKAGFTKEPATLVSRPWFGKARQSWSAGCWK